MVATRATAERRRRARQAWQAVVAPMQPRVVEALGPVEAEAFLARLEFTHIDLYEALELLYGARAGGSGAMVALIGDLLEIALEAAAARPVALRALDRRREIDQGWFQRARMLGYVCYVDRFTGTLPAVQKRLDYLGELGVTYLHLMPLLQPRLRENDGGYAVADYRAVDPRLGTMADLEDLAEDLHGRGMSLCLDLVLNHTAQEHEWARRARAGEARYRDFYLVFPDRSEPDAYEQRLPEVFPDTAPGNFTFDAAVDGWVWTTFHPWQWDLDWSNPDVFAAMLDTALFLVNRGVDVLRLDAVPFLWKRLGTDCQNQPEAHLIVQALRALVRLVAPGVLLKAEAIVAPELLVQYLGAHENYRPECDLAYNNQLMVMLWSSLAAKDGRLITLAMSRLAPAPPPTGWVTYLRCHDDIGWAVSDSDAAALGWDGYAHRRFLNDFYAGRFPGSYSRGVLFQENPHTGDARISGTAAALCGIEEALELGSAHALDAAVRRLVLLYSVVFSYGGIPLIYMGDEIALGNDTDWAADSRQAHDNRWLHRPPMNWAAADRRHDPDRLEGRVFAALSGLAAARREQLALRAGGETTPLWTDSPHVFAYRRRHLRSAPLVALANFAEQAQTVDAGVLFSAGLREPVAVHSSEPGAGLTWIDGRILVPALGFVWVADD